MNASLRIDDIQIGEKFSVFIIAELSANHYKNSIML